MYRVSHFKQTRLNRITFSYTIPIKKIWDRNCWLLRGTCHCDLEFDLGIKFQARLFKGQRAFVQIFFLKILPLTKWPSNFSFFELWGSCGEQRKQNKYISTKRFWFIYFFIDFKFVIRVKKRIKQFFCHPAVIYGEETVDWTQSLLL